MLYLSMDHGYLLILYYYGPMTIIVSTELIPIIKVKNNGQLTKEDWINQN